MGNSARNQHSSRPSFRIPRDHFVPGKRFCSKTNPRKLQGFERHTLSWRRSRDAAPSDGGPRGGGPRGAAALMRRDAPRPSRTWHAPSAWRASCARRPLRSSTRSARVPCAERVPCAVRATVPPAARCRSICCMLPYWVPLVDAVLNVVVWAAARRRGRESGSRCSRLDAANSWPSRLRSTSQTIMLVVLERILLSSLRCATGIVCMGARWREGCLKCV